MREKGSCKCLRKEAARTNIYDISHAAGVSIATVSRVLNGSSRVSPATRARVEKVMAECGYTPNAFARGLGLGSMKTVGLLCADFADPYLAQAVAYLEELLHRAGYDCLLACTGYDPSERRKMVELLVGKKVDGLIFAGSSQVYGNEAEDAIIREVAQQLPVMIMGAALEGAGICSVFCDDRSATKEAAELLLREDRARILYLYHSRSYSGLKKLAGFKDALTTAGRGCPEELIRLYEGEAASPTAVRDSLLRLWQEGLTFDAVLTSDDKLALGAVKFAHVLGLRVPEELSIIGFNDSTLARCCEPELTTVDNRLHTQCTQCVDTLTRILSGEEAPTRSVWSGALQLRGTTLSHKTKEELK